MDDIITFAQNMADKAGAIARDYFRKDLEIISKEDLTPVTIADREIEEKLRGMIENERPEDGIIGEEFGTRESQNGYTWVIDPIDGTKSFTIGRPTFGTLIGLCRDGEPVLGIIDQPITKERWLGVQGRPTTFNGEIVKTRACADLKSAIFGTGSATQIGEERLKKLNAACRYTVFQGDCYFYGLMANGAIDVIVEDKLGVYDYIALVPIIEGAGGRITDWNDKRLSLDSGRNVVACGDAALHNQILKLLA